MKDRRVSSELRSPLMSMQQGSLARLEHAEKDVRAEIAEHNWPTTPAIGRAESFKDKSAESFKVFARLRPAAKSVKASADIRVVRSHGQQCIIQARNLEFLLDHVWDDEDTQEDEASLSTVSIPPAELCGIYPNAAGMGMGEAHLYALGL